LKASGGVFGIALMVVIRLITNLKFYVPHLLNYVLNVGKALRLYNLNLARGIFLLSD